MENLFYLDEQSNNLIIDIHLFVESLGLIAILNDTNIINMNFQIQQQCNSSDDRSLKSPIRNSSQQNHNIIYDQIVKSELTLTEKQVVTKILQLIERMSQVDNNSSINSNNFQSQNSYNSNILRPAVSPRSAIRNGYVSNQNSRKNILNYFKQKYSWYFIEKYSPKIFDKDFDKLLNQLIHLNQKYILKLFFKYKIFLVNLAKNLEVIEAKVGKNPSKISLEIFTFKTENELNDLIILQIQINYFDLIACQSMHNINLMDITDGNSKCVETLIKHYERNQVKLTEKTNVYELIWSKEMEQLQNPFDFVFISDCLFFADYHDHLVHTLQAITNKNHGKVYIMAPKRGLTQQKFLEKAQYHFNIEINQCEEFQKLMSEKVLPQFQSNSVLDSEQMIPDLIVLTPKSI